MEEQDLEDWCDHFENNTFRAWAHQRRLHGFRAPGFKEWLGIMNPVILALWGLWEDAHNLRATWHFS